jgi:phage tail protein X
MRWLTAFTEAVMLAQAGVAAYLFWSPVILEDCRVPLPDDERQVHEPSASYEYEIPQVLSGARR